MCGIAGLIYSDPSRSVDSAVIPDMSAVIQLSGPDEILTLPVVCLWPMQMAL